MLYLKHMEDTRVEPGDYPRNCWCNSVRGLDLGERMAMEIEVKGQIRNILKQAVMRF